MAAAADSMDHSPSSSKKRRIDGGSHPLSSSASLVSPLLDTPGTHDAVAFSNDGLVAFRPVARTSSSSPPGPPTILVRPLLAAWKAPPLVLTAPLAHPHPDVTYQAPIVQFSPSSRSLLAVFTPKLDHLSHLHAQGIHGLACIWTRTSSHDALNHGWQLSASWPLSEHGATPLGCGILAVRWLSDVARASQIIAAEDDDARKTAEKKAQPTQLPGDANAAATSQSQAHRRLTLLRTPPCGPFLRSKAPATPEAALLIGVDGMVHLIHRNTSIHAWTGAHSGAQAAPFQTISAPLTAPSPATPNYGHLPLPSHSRVALVSVHPLMAEEKLLVASVRQDAPHRVDLTEVEVSNRGDDGIAMASRPLAAFRVQDILGKAEMSPTATPALTAIAFTSSLTPTPTPTPGGQAQAGTQWSESISLVISLGFEARIDDTSSSSSLLATLRIKRHSSGAGAGYLSPAFASLESRKKQVGDLSPESDWVATLRDVHTLQGRRIVDLRAEREWDGKAWAGRVVAVSEALGGEGPNRGVERSTSAPMDPHAPQPQWRDDADAESRSVSSPNGHLRFALRTEGMQVIPRPAASDDTALLSALARSLALSLLNKTSYADLLVDHAPLLSEPSGSTRSKVLSLLAQGLGVSPLAKQPARAGVGAGTYRLQVMAALLQVQRGMAAVALAAHGCGRRGGHGQARAQMQAQREIAEADWFLRLAHAHRLLSAGMMRVPNPSSSSSDGSGTATTTWQCDPRAVFALLPCVGFLIEECERIAREAFLLQSGSGAGAGAGEGMDTPPLTPKASAGTGTGDKEATAGGSSTANPDADLHPDIALLPLLTHTHPHAHNPAHALLANTLLLSLRFIAFLRSTAHPDVTQRIVQSEAARVVREYRLAEHAKRSSSGSGSGGGGGVAQGQGEAAADATGGPTHTYTPPQAVSAQLALARTGMEELLRRAGVHYEAFVRRVASFRPEAEAGAQGESAQTKQGGKWSLWPSLPSASAESSSEQKSEEEALDADAAKTRRQVRSFAQHLFSGAGAARAADSAAGDQNAAAAATAEADAEESALLTWDARPSPRVISRDSGGGASQTPVLKNSGLHLFLAPERDFILSLEDVDVDVGGGATSDASRGGAGAGAGRDGVDFTPLAKLSPNLKGKEGTGVGVGIKRDVLTGQSRSRFPGALRLPGTVPAPALRSSSTSNPAPSASAAPGPSGNGKPPAEPHPGGKTDTAPGTALGSGTGVDPTLLDGVLSRAYGGAAGGCGVGRVLRGGCASFFDFEGATQGQGQGEAGWGWGWWSE